MMFATDCIWCLPGGMCGCGVDTKGHLGLRQSEGMCINALRQDDVCKQGSTIVKIVCSFTCLTICSAFQTSVIIFPGWRSPWLSFNTIRRRVDFWQVEPGGVGGEVEEELLFFCKTFDFKHLCDDWREGPTGKKPLTSRCCPDVQNQPRSMKVKVTVFCGNVSNGHFVVFDI